MASLVSKADSQLGLKNVFQESYLKLLAKDPKESLLDALMYLLPTSVLKLLHGAILLLESVLHVQLTQEITEQHQAEPQNRQDAPTIHSFSMVHMVEAKELKKVFGLQTSVVASLAQDHLRERDHDPLQVPQGILVISKAD